MGGAVVTIVYTIPFHRRPIFRGVKKGPSGDRRGAENGPLPARSGSARATSASVQAYPPSAQFEAAAGQVDDCNWNGEKKSLLPTIGVLLPKVSRCHAGLGSDSMGGCSEVSTVIDHDIVTTAHLDGPCCCGGSRGGGRGRLGSVFVSTLRART